MTSNPPPPPGDINEHRDAIPAHDCFGEVRFRGDQWDLSHLSPLVMHECSDGVWLTVVVSFSCHCFTHDATDDGRSSIPFDEYYWDNRERRVLNPERYRLSREFLPTLVQELGTRQIRVTGRGNYFTTEVADSLGRSVQYAVFFELEKDRTRAKRLRLRVQSAYPLDGGLNRRQREAGKVRFNTLVKATYQGRTIKG